MAFLLDSNVFIRAKNEYYGFDICRGFWDWLDGAAKDEKVLSVESVYDELAPQSDELADWVRVRSEYFVAVTSEVVAAAQRVNTWAVENPQFTAAAKTSFAAAADSWLVAHGLEGNHTLVTHELIGRYKKNIVKIPNAAAEFGVRCIQPHQMLRELGARFVLDRPQKEQLF